MSKLMQSIVLLVVTFSGMTIDAAEDTAGEVGWVSLFDGKTLKGWEQKNGTAAYRVEDGAIVGTTAEGSPNSFLCSTKDYGNFELEFEVKVDDKLNSGVQIRSLSLADVKNGRVHGPQVEIEAAPGAAGYIYSEGTGRGWLSKKRTRHDVFENGEWNRYRVLAEGARIRTWVNDEPIADVADDGSSQRGFIGLQVHGIPKKTGPYEVRWRNLRVRVLDNNEG